VSQSHYTGIRDVTVNISYLPEHILKWYSEMKSQANRVLSSCWERDSSAPPEVQFEIPWFCHVMKKFPNLWEKSFLQKEKIILKDVWMNIETVPASVAYWICRNIVYLILNWPSQPHPHPHWSPQVIQAATTNLHALGQLAVAYTDTSYKEVDNLGVAKSSWQKNVKCFAWLSVTGWFNHWSMKGCWKEAVATGNFILVGYIYIRVYFLIANFIAKGNR